MSSGDKNGKGKFYFRGRGGLRPYWLGKKKKKKDEGDTSQAKIYSFTNVDQQPVFESNPFKAWKRYFPDEKYASKSELVHCVKLSEQFFHNTLAPGSLEDVEEKRFLAVDLKAVSENELFSGGWEDFKEELTEEPRRTLNCLSLGLHKLISDNVQLEPNEEFPEVYVRIVNHDPVIPIKNLKAGLYGKLVSVRGTVIRVGSCKLQCSWLGFSCGNCGTSWAVNQPNGTYKAPTSCKGTDCRSRTFVPLVSSSNRLTRSRNCQTLKMQENAADDEREGGRVPRTLEVELTDDLVDTSAPGDTITVTGIVKVRNREEGNHGGITKKAGRCNNNLYTTYLEAVSLVNSKGKSARNQGNIGVEFSLKDYYAIQEIHEESKLFRLLVNSVCPGVYGHEMVKAGLLLALTGGSAESHSRGMPHVLVVGDPGLGKTHLLHSCAALAPRGIYVCGNTASSSGLTVTLVKEPGGDFGLEAGALVLANHGVCCIDEFDKMTSQHMALLEAMEQQCVSVAKGGIVCTLPAHTTILAAANPAGGHFIRGKSLMENLKMSLPLLSRFDLIFVLLDKPNEQLDSLLSEHVMALHSGNRKNGALQNASTIMHHGSTMSDEEMTLQERLRVMPGEDIDYIPQALLRKYIAYVRKYVPYPRLSPEAASALQKFYLELRQSHQRETCTPVTTRQLESMIRLTQARAKVELREEATESDAADIIELMKWSMMDLNASESGPASARVHGNTRNPGSITGSKAKKFIAALTRRSELEGKTVFALTELKDLARDMGLRIDDFYGFVSGLNAQGFLLSKGGSRYQLLSV